jgi:hypothetical protein
LRTVDAPAQNKSEVVECLGGHPCRLVNAAAGYGLTVLAAGLCRAPRFDGRRGVSERILLVAAHRHYTAFGRRCTRLPGRAAGYGPFALGVMATVLMLVGKFMFDLPAVTYGGTLLLISGSVWNSWPVKRTTAPVVVLSSAAPRSRQAYPNE